MITWPLKIGNQKSNANRLNEIAAMDFSFDMGDESVSEELAIA
jgi:hypothetical protein